MAEPFDGTESVPILQHGGNPRATLVDLREYFRDSTLVIFDAFDDTQPLPLNFPIQKEEGATYDIVYLTKRKIFAERKTKGDSTLYSTAFTRSTDYQDTEVRTDKVFFCIETRDNYTYDGATLIGTLALIEPTEVTDITSIL